MSRKATVFLYALGTFLTLSAVTVVGWKMMQPEAAASAQVQPAAVQAQVLPEQHDHEHEAFPLIEVADFKAKLDRNEVYVLDVRSLEQFKAGHIATALQIPLTLVEGEVEYLPKDKPIVTYCTCPAEETSGQAALILKRGGLTAFALKGGLDAWRAAGYPVASGLK